MKMFYANEQVGNVSDMVHHSKDTTTQKHTLPIEFSSHF